jgi:hypothetical protein
VAFQGVRCVLAKQDLIISREITPPAALSHFSIGVPSNRHLHNKKVPEYQ